MRRMRTARGSIGAVLAGCLTLVFLAVFPAASSATTSTWSGVGVNCGLNKFICTEVSDDQAAFGHYVGHDEPSVLFYSTQPGSGNQMQYAGVLPTEPMPDRTPGAKSYSFEDYVATWFGMAMCDSQSFPNTTTTCIPDSDANAVKPGNPYHPGTAYMELQFYPPGYVLWPGGDSCSATQWCVALNIDSYSANALTGQQLNSSCQAQIGSVEYVNFAFLTPTGKPEGPPNPVQANVSTFTPNPQQTFFLNQGDHFTVNLHDTQHGLETIVTDTTTGMSGYMTASAANGFGQVKFAPKGTTCQEIPYDFHPMYSTTTPSTTVPWAAATYNIAFDTEIGHFDYCSQAVQISPVYGGNCSGYEGIGANKEPTDSDDYACFSPKYSSLVKITGCYGENLGYDGTSYQPDWPNGDNRKTATPFEFTSPLTGPAYNTNYTDVAFNTDTPRVEADLGSCDRTTGAGCSIIPPTDDGGPAAFYPYYSIGKVAGGCGWAIGQGDPRFSQNDFGQQSEYGSLLDVTYIGPNGVPVHRYNDYNNDLGTNPCPASINQ